MEKQNLDNLAVGGHNVFHSAEEAGKKLNMWEGFDKQLEIDKGKTLGDLVKEVAETDGLSEEEVLRHLEAVNKIMGNASAPKFKNNKQKSKDKSKRKQAKKSRKRNR